jgi:hypothetical protein
MDSGCQVRTMDAVEHPEGFLQFPVQHEEVVLVNGSPETPGHNAKTTTRSGNH